MKSLKSKFKSCIHKIKQQSPNKSGEILYFEALMDLLQKDNNVHVSKLHGTSHTVQFKGEIVKNKLGACCELCDLLIVTFDKNEKSLNLTFHQSKYYKKVKADDFYPSQLQKAKLLKCNVEQWQLLAKFPTLENKPGSGFNPRKDLLKGPVNPSLGSYGIFYGNNEIDIFYSVAENMFLNQRKYSTQIGSFYSSRTECSEVAYIYPYSNRKHRFNKYVLSCLGLDCFIDHLLNMRIGTPVLYHGAPVDVTRLDWLEKTLKLLEVKNELTDQANNLLKMIGRLEFERDKEGNGGGIKHIFIIEK